MKNNQTYVIWKHNFIVSIKTSDIYKDIAEDVETRYVTSNITERETQKCNWFNER